MTALAPSAAQAVDATWLTTATIAGPTPGTFDFDAAANWNPATVPTGTAFFGTSTTPALSFSTSTTIGGWTFNAGASNYSFTNSFLLQITGAGIVINGGRASITNTDNISFSNTSTAGSASITNNGVLSFNNTSTASTATITNNALLAFNDSGTASSATIVNNLNMFFNDSSAAGSASITNNKDITFGGGSTAGSATITTNSGGLTSINSSGGTARFIVNGTGILDIENLFTSGTTAGSIEGSGKIFLGSKNLAVGANNLSTTFSGVMLDAGGTGGSLTKTGAGTLTLSGISTYTGGTTVTGGLINFNTANNFGTGAITLDGGGLQWATGTSTDISSRLAPFGSGGGTFDTNGNNVTFASALSGTGGLTKTGTGTLALSGVNTYTGATTIDGGTLAISGSGGITSNVTNNATFANNGAVTGTVTNAATFNNNIGGTVSGLLTNNSGTATNSGALNGGAIVNGGLLANNGAIAGTVTNAATFNNNVGGTVSGILTNSGTATNSGTLNGVVNAGLLSNNAAITGTFTNSGTFNNNVGSTVSGLLTNTSGTTTSAGALNGGAVVNGGLLTVNGTAVAVTVNAGGTLGGNGIVGNTTINGGALAPGNSIGTLTVQGSLVFTAASSYMVEVSPANADRTNVTGTATLGGATVQATFAPGTYVAKQYTIVNATGGVNGAFSGPVNTNLPSGFHTSLSYDANDAFLNLLLNFVPPPGTGLSGNQQNVGNAIINFFNTTGGIPIVFGGLTPAGLSQLSGEVATGSQQTTFNAMGLFMGLLTDPFVAGRGDPVSAGASAGTSAYTSQDKPRAGAERDAYAAIYRKAPVMADPFVQRWSVWAAGYGGSQTTDGNAALGSNNTTSRIAGGVVGADYRFSPFTLAGFALAGGGTNFSISNGLGSGRSDLFQAGAFVRHSVGPAYLSAALAYGWQDITTDRTVTIAGVDQLRAKFNANAWSGRVEGGYRFVTPWMGLTPYAAGQFTTFDLPAYAEQAVVGANTFALAYGSKSVTASRSELGLRTDNSWAMQDGIFTVRGRLAWAHDFNIDRIVGATFQTLPGASFVVNGAAQAHDAALVTASAEKRWLNGFSLAATFEGEFSNVTRSYAGKGVVRYSW